VPTVLRARLLCEDVRSLPVLAPAKWPSHGAQAAIMRSGLRAEPVAVLGVAFRVPLVPVIAELGSAGTVYALFQAGQPTRPTRSDVMLERARDK
jgi:hypothetical protein